VRGGVAKLTEFRPGGGTKLSPGGAKFVGPSAIRSQLSVVSQRGFSRGTG
jgi:hypothetical protein